MGIVLLVYHLLKYRKIVSRAYKPLVSIARKVLGGGDQRGHATRLSDSHIDKVKDVLYMYIIISIMNVIP